MKLAYEMTGDHLLHNLSLKPHEIRTILASLNFHDFMNIMKVWKERQTFDHFYFRVMAVGPVGHCSPVCSVCAKNTEKGETLVLF